MDIKTVVMGGMHVPSLIVLKSREEADKHQVNLPIQIGPVEAAAISAGVGADKPARPLTHDLLVATVDALGGRLVSLSINDVRGTTFFATIKLMLPNGSVTELDCRPSDGVALAVRCGLPIYVREHVLDTATMPDFEQAERDAEESQLQAFHDFVEGLSPEDFG